MSVAMPLNTMQRPTKQDDELNPISVLPDGLMAYLNKILSPTSSAPIIPPQAQWHGVTHAERAALVYAKLTSHRFCRKRPAESSKFLRIIEQSLRQNTPIPFVLGHGPLKNPNNAPQQSVDWAEWFAYTQLLRLHQAIQHFHAPGLRIQLYMDDTRAAYANGIPHVWMNQYMESVSQCIEQAPFKTVLDGVLGIGQLSSEFPVERYLSPSHHVVAQWANQPENQAELAQRVTHALRNRPNSLWPEGLSPDQKQSEARESVLRYMAYHEAEKQAGVWNQPDTLYMRYSAHVGHYQVFTLRRGSVAQPWQGQGAVIRLNAEKWDVTLHTQNRHHSTYERIDSSVIQELFEIQSLPGYLPVVLNPG